MKFAFLVSLLASLSTLVGALLIFIKPKSRNKLISGSLAFSSGVMTIISIFSLIPSSINGLLSKYNIIFTILLVSIFITLGILLSISINKFFPNKYQSDGLYRVGIFSMIAIILHNIPEGIATFLTTRTDVKLGITLAIAISLHNIPEGISISIPIYFSTQSKTKAILYTFLSGISELFGAFLAYLFLSKFDVSLYVNLLYAFIAGIMLSLVIEELLPSAIIYYNILNTIYYFLIGAFFMFILNYLV